MLLDKISKLIQEVSDFEVENKEQLEQFRLNFIARKGVMNDLFVEFKNVAKDQKRAVGQSLNELKKAAEEKFSSMRAAIEEQEDAQGVVGVDVSLPPLPEDLGSIHPLTATKERIIEIFERMGFSLSEGPEIEDDIHNFESLNFPHNHPAREMQDTFFLQKDPDVVLRTHTSSVQVRVMQGEKPPIRTLSVGRVYRNETISARAHCMFHQVEGLYVDKNVSFKDLKQTLYHFAKELFGQGTKIRLRPSYFPFTEPSAEVDISCFICGGKGCNICKYTGWVEILGCGMVDPKVLENCGIDPEVYTGFAFGMGIERITMLKYQIKDLRLFTENDLRFLKQFQGFS
jgi:phenylalanyl-tRNA synthetase alpha chain